MICLRLFEYFMKLLIFDNLSLKFYDAFERRLLPKRKYSLFNNSDLIFKLTIFYIFIYVLILLFFIAVLTVLWLSIYHL